MAGNEYAVSTGGSLKLKGVSASGVKKKKKKKQPQPQQHSKAEHPPAAEASHDAAPSARPHAVSAEAAAASSKQSTSPRRTEDDDDDDDEQSAYVGKTEAEIRHEQMRKKRLNDRIKREGVQTHKERVEGLNRYLSALSEHHDMPRIGPG